MESGWVYCEDKGPDGKLVNYSPEEMDILKNRGLKLAHDVHLIKKIFGGRIVNYDGKPDSIVNDTNTGGEIPETGEIGKNIRQGELDIY
ncbi:MAG: hypothetical protein LBT95_02080 [Treponema sp.]|nr:hypothetical protein [Treponema sp.]